MKRICCCFLIMLSGIFLTHAQQLRSSDAGSDKLTQREDLNARYRFRTIDLDIETIEKEATLKQLVYDRAKDGIRLQDTELIEDDGPATGLPEGYESYTRGPVEWVEDLRKGIVIKKLLVVEHPASFSTKLVFKGMEVKGNKAPLFISVNGTRIERPASIDAYPHARQYIDMSIDRWYYIDLPADKLRKGQNEILMWTESDSTSWRILIAHAEEFKRGSLTRTEHPNRSMKSKDGGQTFSDTKLGAMDKIDGEYSIRLSLDRYLSNGEYISPVIDVIDGDNPLKRKFDNLKLSIQPLFYTFPQTQLRTFVRFGTNPDTNDPSWTDWKSIGGELAADIGDKRYLQWRAELTTSDPLMSPVLKRFHIRAEWKDRSSIDSSGTNAYVNYNGEIIEQSYPFSYENLLHSELKRFREAHRLDQVVAGANSEFEMMMKLLNWAYRVPLTLNAYSWNWNDVTTPPIIDASTGMPKLNGPFFNGRRMVGMCLYPNQALIGALLSMGFQARHINIHSEGMSGHEVTEVWSNEFNKWIYMDATRDYYYYDMESGIPLNALEIHNLLAASVPGVETWERPFVPYVGEAVASKVNIGMRQGDNPFSIQEGGGLYLLKAMGHFRIIPRNDFLSHPLPVPVHTGNTMWGWDGFVNWYDDTFPKRLEYQNYTNREIDFYQPLNQAKVYLYETDKPGILRVDVQSYSPGGAGSLMLSIDHGEWVEQKQMTWTWRLKSGMNNIRVRTKNVRGIVGPVSDLNVSYNP